MRRCSDRGNYRQKADEILKEHGFGEDGKVSRMSGEVKVLPMPDYIPEESIGQAILEYNDGKERDLQIDISELHESFESPFTSINGIS